VYLSGKRKQQSKMNLHKMFVAVFLTAFQFFSIPIVVEAAKAKMSTVRVVQARVQSDIPLWDEEKKIYTSKYGSTFEQRYRAALDTVNTASVEGALMYVQAEGIDIRYRSVSDRCWRKNNMKVVVFYQLDITQTPEMLEYYQNNAHAWETMEYGPMIPMDGGRCTPIRDEILPQECYMYNGQNGLPNLGPTIGGATKVGDPRANYPNTWWYSLPHTCPTNPWSSKTDICREKTRKGLCDYGTKPDGKTCTFAYKILGYVFLDELVGITKMRNKAKTGFYANFQEFCNDGNIEFQTNEQGKVLHAISFWQDYTNPKKNQERAKKLIDLYQNLVKDVNNLNTINMTALPTPKELAKLNPPCYYNVKNCAKGCKRTLYGQLCVPCTKNEEGCQIAPRGFVYGKTVKEITPSLAPSPRPKPKPTPKPSPGTSVSNKKLLDEDRYEAMAFY
jgi:hypothetical protein